MRIMAFKSKYESAKPLSVKPSFYCICVVHKNGCFCLGCESGDGLVLNDHWLKYELINILIKCKFTWCKLL